MSDFNFERNAIFITSTSDGIHVGIKVVRSEGSEGGRKDASTGIDVESDTNEVVIKEAKTTSVE